jgi:leucine dehydrogenase
MWPYKTRDDALNDVLRLSRGMTYKNAVAGLNIGGGKAVIIGDPATDKSEALFRAFGQFVESLGGRYITAEDVGIDVNDMEYVYRETEYVTGVHQVHGGSGDPSPFTAYGTLQGLMATLNKKYGDEEVGKYSARRAGPGPRRHGVREAAEGTRRQDLRHRHQPGAGREGGDRVRRRGGGPGRDLRRAGRRVLAVRARRHRQRADPAPAEGQGHLRRGQQPAGQQRDRRRSRARGILYAPDYAVNAGGVMNVALELDGYNRERAMRMMRTIYHNLGRIYEISRARRHARPTRPPTAWPRNASPRSASSSCRWAARSRASRAGSAGTDD